MHLFGGHSKSSINSCETIQQATYGKYIIQLSKDYYQTPADPGTELSIDLFQVIYVCIGLPQNSSI